MPEHQELLEDQNHPLLVDVLLHHGEQLWPLCVLVRLRERVKASQLLHHTETLWSGRFPQQKISKIKNTWSHPKVPRQPLESRASCC